MTNDNNYIFGDNEEEHNANRDIFLNRINLAQSMDEAEEHMRTLSTDKRDQTGMRLHMINAHQFSIDETTWANEGPHDKVPRIQHKMSMMQGYSDERYPKLDHEDILAWHEHDHTAGEFAEDYPSEDTGEEHKHF